MAEINLNLADLFQQAFGYNTDAFDPQFDKTVNSKQSAGSAGTPFYAVSDLGVEYFMPVTLVYSAGSTSAGSTTQQTQKSVELPYPIISISAKKTIVDTPMTERNGTVKELISARDLEITVKGFAIGKRNEFPEAQIAAIETLYEQQDALSIQCALTDIFLVRSDRSGSDNVVITELSFPEIEGVTNIRPYELKMVSDEPFNLISIS